MALTPYGAPNRPTGRNWVIATGLNSLSFGSLQQCDAEAATSPGRMMICPILRVGSHRIY